MIAKRLITAAALFSVVSVAALAQSTDPLVGTWKLNVAKSTGAAFKSGTSKIEAAGKGIRFTVDLAQAESPASHWSFTANYDGKDNPVTGNSPYGDTVAVFRVDAHTTRMITKRAGKVTVTQTIVVSEDGKTRTTTTKGTNAKGQPVDTLSFYEKQ